MSSKVIVGKGNISAEVVAHSVTEWGKEIVTFALEYPRFIHGELMTHRLFSRNAASSRAIPVQRMIELVDERPAEPIHWGRNQSGMQAKEELTGDDLNDVQWQWESALRAAVSRAEAMAALGAHKQIVNRILEPFQMMRTIVTATELKNFFHLRNHPDAQPEIAELARVMLEAVVKSEAIQLKNGEWHVPYVSVSRDENGEMVYGSLGEDGVLQVLSLEDALKVSSSCCAQVSYRRLDDSVEKALAIYDRLVYTEPVHASPFEHQATPVPPHLVLFGMEGKVFDVPGITHLDKDGAAWSGNFKGWIQHRQLIPNNVVM